MSTMRTEPESAPESAKGSDEKWKTSPDGPLDGRGQTRSRRAPRHDHAANAIS